MGIHDGHRDRMKNRFLEHGIDNFSDHEVLEMLMYYSVPRSDTNPTAHRLLEKFGSLSAVFDAPIGELTSVEGVGANTATLIKLMPQIYRRYAVSRESINNILNTTTKAGDYLVARFCGETEEVVYLVCLDSKCKVLACKMLARGETDSANLSIRKVVETALACNASSAILSHNHASGIALPSKEDEFTTRRVASALAAVNITLADHIIVAGGDYVSFADSGFFRV